MKEDTTTTLVKHEQALKDTKSLVTVMIESTFLHLPRVGVTTEQKLWQKGVHGWNDFLNKEKIKGFSAAKKASSDVIVKESKKALVQGNSTFFINMPSTSHWRLWNNFKDEAVFVDIETNWHHDITVLGIYDGNEVKQLVKGNNLTKQAVKQHLQGKLIVTYNGASFDLPIIKRYFGDCLAPTPHFDTRHLAARLGYVGGLKPLEKSLGIRRPEDLEGVSGMDALHLWDLYLASGEQSYLDTLLRYNEEDIVNLAVVAKKLVHQATQELQATHFGK